ncbi:membrane protein insertase YidC [Akkermansia glycaniphila]|uniref:membrane protein insertase YidC n=1 Tax=Akkermansia glycaniphila TaxID=1679444 RepID=UPI001C024028|nr:membrane protein insertase YidC [Akkermansia glycaniphila]MBT9450213.1 membrane protein insertase YidC [Akkermansia glycaniphila]
MDKKAWIIVILCCACLGLSLYYSDQNQKIKDQNAQLAAAKQPTMQTQPSAAPAAPAAETATATAETATAPSTRFTPKTIATLVSKDNGKDIAKFAFSNKGGSLEYVEICEQQINSQTVPDHHVRINEDSPVGIGAIAYNLSGHAAPLYDETEYTLLDSSPTTVRLLGKSPDGKLGIIKEYSLKPAAKDDEKSNLYTVSLKITMENISKERVSHRDIGIMAGGGYPIAKNENADAYTNLVYQADGDYEHEAPSYFKGGWFSDAKDREFKTLNNITWGGVMNQYYATLLIPGKDSTGEAIYTAPRHFKLKHENSYGVNGVEFAILMPAIDLRPVEGEHRGDQKTVQYDIYAGPKLNQYLSGMPNQLDSIMGYGWLWILAAPMNWLLNLFHGWLGNWGWSIVCMTIVVRLLIWPLHKKSYMSMKRMSLMQPKMKELKEKYGDDKQKINMEMMKLYQQYGINPASGCLPMLLQIPIFFAFYRVLQYSAELRGQSFLGWIHDLSLPDTVATLPIMGWDLPINILPVIMAVTMIIQMKLTPKAGDPTQQKIMAFMPWIFFFFCYNFASALALYWTVQNLISIGQSYIIRRLPMPELTKQPKKKGGFLQRMMEAQKAALEEQQKRAQGQRPMRNVTKK